jgi:hypothetical protein
MENIKNLIQIANRIQESLMRIRNSRYMELLSQLTSIADNLSDITKQSRKLRLSVEHDWLSAAKECCEAVNRFGDDISCYLSQFKQIAEKPLHEIPKLSTLVEDLKQLKQEFDKVNFDKKANTLSVITEPITLEDVYLGPFEIRLELNRLSELYRCSPFYCIALDPHPAGPSEDVTHPHVSGERLCEGEGYASIRAALEQGRICDFFAIVRGILNTYSPDSPYVSLSEWEGEACYECGYTVDSENSYYCGFCDHTYCGECSTCCRGCDETVCLSCSQQCPHCEENVCPNCMRKCSECGSLCCISCLEDDLCPKCVEELEKKDEQPECQIDGTDKNTGTDQPQTGKPEIRLAG